jgi:hypothetical protein
MVAVTREFIDSGRSIAGGWTREQLAVLGVSWPPPKGWKDWACEHTPELSEADAARFLRGRNATRKAKVLQRRHDEAKQPGLFSGLPERDDGAC